MVFTNIAVTACKHNRLMITATLTSKIHLKGSEITTDIGTTKFIIKCRATQWSFGHNIQRRDNAAGLAIIRFPRLHIIWNLQIGDGKTNQTHLGLRASTHRTFITNFTPRTGTSTRVRRNSCGMIMGFNLHQQMHWLLAIAIFFCDGIRVKTPTLRTGDHRGII